MSKIGKIINKFIVNPLLALGLAGILYSGAFIGLKYAVALNPETLNVKQAQELIREEQQKPYLKRKENQFYPS